MSGIVDWDAGHVRDRLLDVAMLTFTAMWRAEWPVLQHLWAYFFSIGEEQPVLTSPSLLTVGRRIVGQSRHALVG